MLEKLIKARNKKGFTLVELIVVLVILAILAAIMVPALLGWIDKANEKTSAAQARAVYVSAQATATELYGKGIKISGAIKGNDTNSSGAAAHYGDFNSSVKDLVDDDATVDSTTVFHVSNNKVLSLEYDGETYVYDN